MIPAVLALCSIFSPFCWGQESPGAWPPLSQAAATAFDGQYGEPDEVTPWMLAWRERGPWRRVVVYREGAERGDPYPHHDLIEHAVDYAVPASKATNLLKFCGSLIIDQSRGTLASRGDSEQWNILVLNLADEIVRGRRSVGSARRFLRETMEKNHAGKSSPYVETLLFSSKDGADTLR